MSVVAMKKLSLFCPKEHGDELLSKLTKLRCVEVTRAGDGPLGEEMLKNCVLTERKLALEASIAETDNAIAALLPYSKKKFSLVKPKIEADTDKFMSDGSYELAKETVAELADIEKKKKLCLAEIKAAGDEINELSPWRDLDISLAFSGTDKTFLYRGSLPSNAQLGALSEELSELYAVFEPVSSDMHGNYVTVIGLSEFESEINRALSRYGFTKCTERRADTTAADLIFEADKKLQLAKARLAEAERAMRELECRLDILKVLSDIEKTELEKTQKHELLLSSECVEMMNAWVPVDKTARLEELFEKYGCAYEFADPEEDEDVPVLLKNNKFAENFEWVISLYSLPKYGSFDPTFIMAICYAILFGIMFADVGYGLIMILAGFLVPKILNPSPWANKFFRSFGWCGVSCVIMGVLFGGYFGDFPIKIAEMLGTPLPADFRLALLMDPVKESMPFMIMGIGVGAVHLIVGMIIKFNIIRKKESLLDAIFDVGLWWLLFIGLALVFIYQPVGIWVLAAAALGIFLTGGRREKKWFMKPLKGLLAFYDIINYASDLLSYSRILALALTSAVIASVVNVLGTMAGPSPLGFIVLVIAFIFGHALNIALNVMGTFVHSARLQYVEFFGKFFEDGGRAFDPMKPNSQYTNNNNE